MGNTHRVAGTAAIAAAAAYLLQPVLVAANSGEELTPLPSEVRDVWWTGTLQAAVFSGVGIALLVLVLAVGDLIRPAVGGLSAGLRALHVLGVVGAAGWLFAGAMALAGYSTVAAGIADSGAEEPAQRAALNMAWLVLTAGLELASIALALWLGLVSTVGRRAGVVGRPLAWAGFVVAVAMVATAAFVVPFGMLLLIPYLLGLGIRLVRRGRAAPRVVSAVSVSRPW
jgi:hypothetical protein